MNKFYTSLKDIKNLLKIITSISKLFLPFTILANLVKASLPFINIIYGYLILDGLVLGYSKEKIFRYIILMVTLNLILGLLSALLGQIVKIKSDFINITIKSRIALKSLSLDYEELEKKKNIELLFKAKEGSNSNGGISSFCLTISQFINCLFTLIYSIVLLSGLFVIYPVSNPTMLERIYNSPITTILLFLLLSGSLIINFKFMRRINNESYKNFEENVENNRKFSYFMYLSYNYKFGKDIRVYKMSDMIEEEMINSNEKAEIGLRKIAIFEGKYSGYTVIINQLVVFLTYAFVGIKAILGLITIGSVLKFVSSLNKLYTSVNEIINIWVQLDIQRQYLNNYTTFLNLENKKYEGTLPIEKRDDNNYELEFRNVSFHYPNSEDMILKNINLKLHVGRKMAIVGRNGAGKTTFIKLLCRLYDPTEGEILLNGINIKKYDYQEYLSIFSVVFQDFKLFSFSVGQNVATNVNYEENLVWNVLEKAGVSERVHDMKKGLETTIYQNEEDGVEISGGEAQKIAIARALYKNAPLVVLDEPTSALDPISEYEIYSRFDHLVSNKSSIYISHRMSSCRFCDNIIVFDKGEIIQIGNHESLMKNTGGLYSDLWNAQSKYYQ
ncbi:ABC transporter ATP-binding protein [Mycoplasmatota bacterium]|nr:ABC transporter ATP-binding protein [Mycoplasmatota bacterium]